LPCSQSTVSPAAPAPGRGVSTPIQNVAIVVRIWPSAAAIASITGLKMISMIFSTTTLIAFLITSAQQPKSNQQNSAITSASRVR
jgi:hypothetical protein